MDDKYTPLARSTLTSIAIPDAISKLKADITSRLHKAEYISLTIDMQSYLGITTHFIHEASLESMLLDVSQFTGSHTGEQIANAFDSGS